MSQAAIGRGVSITFLGHAAFKVTDGKINVLIDPWLSNPSLNTPVDQVGPVDVILVTHGHGDHVGETVAVAKKTGATVVAIHELSVILAGQGVERVIGMNKGGTVPFHGLEVTMTQAVHSSTMEVAGRQVAAGDPEPWSSFPTASWHPPATRCSGHGAHPELYRRAAMLPSLREPGEAAWPAAEARWVICTAAPSGAHGTRGAEAAARDQPEIRSLP
jgi:hypothetical protein